MEAGEWNHFREVPGLILLSHWYDPTDASDAAFGAVRTVVLRPCDYMADLELAVVWQRGIYCDAADNVTGTLTSEKCLGSSC